MKKGQCLSERQCLVVLLANVGHIQGCFGSSVDHVQPEESLAMGAKAEESFQSVGCIVPFACQQVEDRVSSTVGFIDVALVGRVKQGQILDHNGIVLQGCQFQGASLLVVALEKQITSTS